MALSTTTNRITYTGDASTTIFPYDFRIFANTDLVVTRVVIATGVKTVQTITTQYMVSGAGNATGGNVTMLSAPPATDELVIERSVPYTPGVDLVDNEVEPAETSEDALDKLTMLAQQNLDLIDRSVRLDINQDPDVVSPVLPAPEADKIIGWNDDGTALVNLTFDEAASGDAVAAAAAAAVSEANAANSESAAATSATSASNSATTAQSAAVSASASAASATTSAAEAAASAALISLPLPMSSGGSGGELTAVAGGVIYSTASTMAVTAAGTTGYPLLSKGAAAPAFGQLDLTVGVTGVLPAANGGSGGVTAIANGGTGATTAAGARTNLGLGSLAVLSSVAEGNLNSSSVSQSKLKTSIASYSTLSDGFVHQTLTGGTYSFYPQWKTDGSTLADLDIHIAKAHTPNPTTYVTSVTWASNGTVLIYLQNRYVTASGIDTWIFLMVDKITGKKISVSCAKDHPSYGNGGDPDKLSHPFGSYDKDKCDVVLVDKKTCDELEKEEDIVKCINESYEIGEDSKYIPLHSGKFLDEEPVLIDRIPDYIKVKKLIKRR